MQLFAIDMCKNDAIRLNGHIIKYIDSIHLINSVRSCSLAKLLKIMSLTLRKAECFFFIYQNKVTSSLTFIQRRDNQTHNCKMLYLKFSNNFSSVTYLHISYSRVWLMIRHSFPGGCRRSGSFNLQFKCCTQSRHYRSAYSFMGFCSDICYIPQVLHAL